MLLVWFQVVKASLFGGIPSLNPSNGIHAAFDVQRLEHKNDFRLWDSRLKPRKLHTSKYVSIALVSVFPCCLKRSLDWVVPASSHQPPCQPQRTPFPPCSESMVRVNIAPTQPEGVARTRRAVTNHRHLSAPLPSLVTYNDSENKKLHNTYTSYLYLYTWPIFHT